MLVPEASVHQDDLPPRRKDNVWLSRKVAAMQPEAVSKPVNQPPQDNFRAGVLAANPTHIRAAAFWTDLVHRGTPKSLQSASNSFS